MGQWGSGVSGAVGQWGIGAVGQWGIGEMRQWNYEPNFRHRAKKL